MELSRKNNKAFSTILPGNFTNVEEKINENIRKQKNKVLLIIQNIRWMSIARNLLTTVQVVVTSTLVRYADVQLCQECYGGGGGGGIIAG